MITIVTNFELVNNSHFAYIFFLNALHGMECSHILLIFCALNVLMR